MLGEEDMKAWEKVFNLVQLKVSISYGEFCFYFALEVTKVLYR